MVLSVPRQSQLLRITGRAGSQGPWISFLYFCSPMSHQLQIPMKRPVRKLPRIAPEMAALNPPPETAMLKLAPAPMTRKPARNRWPRHETCRKCRRKTGKSPNTSMEKSMNEKTSVVDSSRDARTVAAMIAALVDREAGNLRASLLTLHCLLLFLLYPWHRHRRRYRHRRYRLKIVRSYERNRINLLCTNAAPIIEEEDVEPRQKASHSPDGVAGG